MKQLSSLLKALAVLLTTFVLAPDAAAQATRTWVSGVGDDVNPCSRTAPCKTFAGAISKTADGGIIDVLDPGGFGGVTITKNITIDGSGGSIAGVLVSGTNAIVVNGAGINVILRNLDIEGVGTGLSGVLFLAGNSLAIEHCRIFGFQGSPATGVRITTGASAKVSITDCDIRDNGTGIHAETSAGLLFVTMENVRSQNNSGNGFEAAGAGLVFAAATHSMFNNNGLDGVRALTSTSTVDLVDSSSSFNGEAGVYVAVAGGRVRISGNSILHNPYGLGFAAGATIESDGTNRIAGFNTSAAPNATFNNQ